MGVGLPARLNGVEVEVLASEVGVPEDVMQNCTPAGVAWACR